MTALAGSGPAFVYRFIDALASGAMALGLPGEQSRRLARVKTVNMAGVLVGSAR